MEFIITPEPGGKKINMNNQLPTISCVCITRRKSTLLKRAITCFTAQSYPQKELIIVYENDDADTIFFIKSSELLLRNDIRLICVNAFPKISLGELRNLGIAAGRGEYICQWDDDDWYHKDRLTDQYNVLLDNDLGGSIMTQWLVFNAIENKAYISNTRVWEGSILCRKSILQSKPYEDKSIGEDTPTIDYLVSNDCLYFMKGVPGIYIYVYHGGNTWDYEHWNCIFECSTELSYGDALVIADILNGKYSIHEGSLLLDDILEIQKIF